METLASILDHTVCYISSICIRIVIQSWVLAKFLLDPVFFLHHANLDRLWSKWQHVHDASAYHGKQSMVSAEEASLNDRLNIGGLLEDVAVSDVLDTTSGIFCYQY